MGTKGYRVNHLPLPMLFHPDPYTKSNNHQTGKNKDITWSHSKSLRACLVTSVCKESDLAQLKFTPHFRVWHQAIKIRKKIGKNSGFNQSVNLINLKKISLTKRRVLSLIFYTKVGFLSTITGKLAPTVVQDLRPHIHQSESCLQNSMTTKISDLRNLKQ